MKTERLHAHEEKDKVRVLNLLTQEKIVALPTETVYGLAAHALSVPAIKKVFAAKNRPLSNPLILHSSSKERAIELFDWRAFDQKAKKRLNRLAEDYWPGPLTIVGIKAQHVPPEASGGLKSVAVRIPMHATTLEILERLSFPLVMPSANLATRPSPSSASHVLATLDGRIDAVLDAGPSELGIESTVIAICDEKPLILRQGHLSKSVLEEALSEHCEESLKLKKDEAPKAPGQSFLHYSPQVKSCHITKISECSSFWQSDSSLIARKSDLDSLTRSLGLRPPSALSISLGDEAPLFARGLYEAFYRCETKPDRDLYIICPPKDEAWLAIYDRIERASAKD